MTEHWKTTDEQPDDRMLDHQEGAEETGTGEPKKAGINTNTLWVLGTFVIALALIWALGKQGGPRPAAAAEGSDESVDAAIQEFTQHSSGAGKVTNVLSDTDELVRMFYNYPGVQSVPLDQLPGNPFAHDGPQVPQAVPNIAPALGLDNLSAEETARLTKLAISFNSLKLSTILVSKHSAALINNHLVMVGGKIGEFIVTDIQPDRVILNAGPSRFELVLAKPNAGPSDPNN